MGSRKWTWLALGHRLGAPKQKFRRNPFVFATSYFLFLALLRSVVFLHGIGAVDPGGVDQVAEFDGSGG
jgi:hypothetical protein